MTDKPVRLIVAIAMVLALAACQQATGPAPAERMAKAPADGEAAAKVSEDEQVDVPDPVKQFEAYCYRTYSDYKRTVGMAELNKLRPMPKKFNPAIEAEAAQGRAYIVEATKDPERAIFLAITEANTCSIYANGYDRSEIRKSLQDNYHLKRAFKDDTGLQITEIMVPNGTTGTVLDTHKNGVISLTYLKDPSTQAITIGFMPPEVAKSAFSL